MTNVRIGIIGLGNMGSVYAKSIYGKDIKGAVLTAVCARGDQRTEWAKQVFGDNVQVYRDAVTFVQEADMDAVIIATPHYDHPEFAKLAFARGLHVLCEKPAGVYTKNVREMNEAAKQSGKVFSMMYNQRTNPLFAELRRLIQSGELGEVKRTNWIITNWYRSQSYYDSSDWRATWAGEGGGVLINQAFHQLDLWQWSTGLFPKRVQAFAGFGKYHDIEVEDDVTIYVEYENGATGVFIASTGEAPGTNRFEIAADRGKVVIENDQLIFYRLEQSEREFNATYTGGFGEPAWTKTEVQVTGEMTAHNGILQDWVNAILNGTELLAPGGEGVKALEIVNAVYLSAWEQRWVDLPINEDYFYEKLQRKIAESKTKGK